MSKATVTIVKKNREKIIVPNVHVTNDPDHARHITDLAIALNLSNTDDFKLAQYDIDGKMIFAYVLDGKGGMLLCHPEK
jgi:hypothetical protein